jgi:predicted transcriptional regulator YheO
VVLHDVRTQKVDNIAKRVIGDDATLEDMLSSEVDERTIGPYEKLNWDGQKIRSVSSVLRDASGTPIAGLCINLNTSLFETAKQALDLFLSSSKLVRSPTRGSATTGRSASTPSCTAGCVSANSASSC